MTKVKVLLISIGVLLVSIESGRIQAQSFSNDCVNANYNQSVVSLGVCESGLRIAVNGVLSQVPSRVKDTKFNKADLRNMRFRLVKEKFDSCGKNAGNCIPSGNERVLPGFRVDGDWQYQHRELLVGLFGKKYYTPWVSFSGTFSQPIYFVPSSSGDVQLVAGRPRLGGSRFTGEVLPFVVGFFNPGGQVQAAVKNTLNNYGITRPREFLVNKAGDALSPKLGVPAEQLKSIFANHLNSLSMDVTNSKLIMSISVGNEVAELSLDKPTSPNPSNFNGGSCFTVDSRRGWQEFPVNNTYTSIASIKGVWSVDSARYSPVGPEGHTGQDAESLSPYNNLKLDQKFPFGALLFNVHNVGYFNPTQPQQLPGSITGSFGMRINDGDGALGDNSGSIEVCLSQ